MKTSGTCPKCSSSRVIKDGRVLDKGSRGGPAMDLELAVEREPGALWGRGEERFGISAWVCAACGYTELYTSNAEAAYRIVQDRG